MVLPEQSKMRVRVHMGVPVMGVQDSGFSLGYRFTNVMGLMEFRLNNLQPYEYASIIGVPVGAAILQGNPALGNVITATINATPYTYTVQAGDLVGSNQPGYNVMNGLATAINAALGASGFVAAPQFAVTYPQPSLTNPQPYWQLAIVSTAGTTFTLAMSVTGGVLTTSATLQGVQPRPFYTFSEDAYTANGYIGICDYLESKTGAASDISPKFAKADVVDFRRDELSARDDNYQYWRQRLADYLGIPLFPMPAASNFGGSNTGLAI